MEIPVYQLKSRSSNTTSIIITHLLLDSIATLLGDVNEIQDTAMEVCQSSDGLHLNDIPLLQRVIQDTRSIDHLPPVVFAMVSFMLGHPDDDPVMAA